MTENKRFIIYMGEPYYNNVFFKYDESADDYQFLCRTNDFGSILEELNALADEIEQKNETNQKLYDKLQVTMSRNSLNMGEIELIKKENEQLKIKNRGLQSELEIQKADIYHANKICSELSDENKELKEILKHTYETHECETCKYNQNFNWLDPATMKREYDSKCSKGLHYGEEVHGCKEYKLDLEMFKKRIWG